MSGQTCRSPGARTVEEEARGDRTVQMILVLATIVTFLGVDGTGHAVVAAYPAVGHVSTGKTAFHQEIAFSKERIEHSFGWSK
ncbi:lachesin-like [Vespula squamosa]|uniref:Lachesin-like n=1 Tax=Vespula squamosa TaxID=30214 RepID=A0ABD2AHA4_VESSQ